MPQFTRFIGYCKAHPDAPHVKAAFAMAPQSLIFDKAGLASINRPVFLYYGQEDEVLRAPDICRDHTWCEPHQITYPH